jgi:hypothetical protein
MITVSLFGGLGNQMFQYAAAKALADHHGVGLGFDLGGFRAHPDRAFLLSRLCVPESETAQAAALTNSRSYFFRSRRRERVGRLMAYFGLPALRSSSDNYREPHFHFDEAFAGLGSDANLFGYFQSERYFGAIESQLRNYFVPRDPLGAAAQATADSIARSDLPVSLHIRRGDYMQPGTAAVHGLLGEAYYRRGLALLENRLGRAPDLFVFSDDRNAAAQVLKFVPLARLTYVDGDPDKPWEDMTLIARCRHHVIANSSFSWWGAWLNPSSDKIVIAPRAWFTPKGLLTRNTKDLYPSAWMLV